MEEDFGVDNSTKLKAYTWCQEYLGGVWKQIDLEDFHIRDLSLDKRHNKHYICRIPPHRSPVYGEPPIVLLRIFKHPILANKRGKCTDEPGEVLLRVYGEIFFEGETPLLDTVIFSLLSERRQAPKLYGVFSEGRLEEFIPSRALRTDELSNPDLSRIIAGKLANFHQLQLPLCKEPRWLDQMLDKWFNKAIGITFEDDSNQQFMKEIVSFDLEAERKFIKRLVAQTKSPVVFSHNDCQEGNILLTSGENSSEKNLILIDYEYSSYNFRAFDFANHFVEWSMNYCIKEAPYYSLIPEDFPSREQQLTFIRAYLAANREMGLNQPGSHGDSAAEEEAILREVKRFCPVSHFLWALWSIVQAKISHTTFGYMEYAVARFKEYFRHKALIPLDMLPSSADVQASLGTGESESASSQSMKQRRTIQT